MPRSILVNTPYEAYSSIQTRLLNDLEPVWQNINSRSYSPFWLLARSMFPVAESIGDLIYKSSKTSENLEKFIDNDLSKIDPIYKNKGKLIALLYRHSLMHQDEPRSIHGGSYTIDWQIAFFNGTNHLKVLAKDGRSRSCTMSFDLRSFYNDLILLLEKYKLNGPKRGVVSRYNSWTFMNVKNKDSILIIKDFYLNGVLAQDW